MAWDFKDVVTFARQFAADGRQGHEIALVFSEWDPEQGMGLMAAYPVVREDLPPAKPAEPAQVDRLYVDLGSGWQRVSDIPTVQRVGIGSVGAIASGVESSMIIVTVKSICAGYILAPSATMDRINADRTTGIALTRVRVEGDEHPLGPDTKFTAAQVTALANWLNAHGITNTEFAGWFDATPSGVSAWLQAHPRWEFAQQIHERWGSG